MPTPETVVYHSIQCKAPGGVAVAFPRFPAGWLPAYHVIESPWSSVSGSDYVIDQTKFEKYLDWMESPANSLNQLWETHSAGPCDPNFDGPMILDMERFPFTENSAVFARIMERCQQWRPKAKWSFYGHVSKWASQWDTDPATYMDLNDRYSRAVYCFHKHIPLYLKTADAPATWERWNEKNAQEVVRQAAVTGGRPYAAVCLRRTNDNVVITTLAQALAQVRPAVRWGCDIVVWDYWYNAGDRDAALGAIALIDQAVSQARAETWSV